MRCGIVKMSQLLKSDNWTASHHLDRGLRDLRDLEKRQAQRVKDAQAALRRTRKKIKQAERESQAAIANGDVQIIA